MQAAAPYNISERITLLLLGALVIWIAIHGVRTGEVTLKFATMKRSDHPVFFWLGVAVNLFGGIALLLASIFGADILK